MNLTFNAIKQENKIEVVFDKEKISFSLDDKNSVSNDAIVRMLTNIAKEITAGNFDKEKNIEKLDQEQLGELKGLYDFICSLFVSFVDKFNEESETFQEQIDEMISRKQNSLKRDF